MFIPDRNTNISEYDALAREYDGLAGEYDVAAREYDGLAREYDVPAREYFVSAGLFAAIFLRWALSLQVFGYEQQTVDSERLSCK